MFGVSKILLCFWKCATWPKRHILHGKTTNLVLNVFVWSEDRGRCMVLPSHKNALLIHAVSVLGHSISNTRFDNIAKYNPVSVSPPPFCLNDAIELKQSTDLPRPCRIFLTCLRRLLCKFYLWEFLPSPGTADWIGRLSGRIWAPLSMQPVAQVPSGKPWCTQAGRRWSAGSGRGLKQVSTVLAYGCW